MSIFARVLLVPALLLSFGIFGCGTTPYTNRSQLLLLGQDQENQLGIQAYQETVGSARLSTNAEYIRMVESAGRRIAQVVERDHGTNFDWEFKVIADSTVNAFALPGGKIAFYEGILPICQSETGVAVVMGHEIAHALLRHGGERVSRSILTQLGISVGALLASDDPKTREMTATALGAAAQVGAELPFSRSQESEADHVGIILMAKAGYDPREAPRFWERMAAREGSGGGTPGFLRTHPTSSQRVDDLHKRMPEAMAYYQQR